MKNLKSSVQIECPMRNLKEDKDIEVISETIQKS